ncbi:hypothetical protein BH23GEM3_BH23GEM3_08040 [soil metagenome]
MSDAKPVVAQAMGTFLPVTENWIYHQMRFLRTVRSVVLAKRTANPESFPWEGVHAIRDQPRARVQYDRFMRNLRGYYPMHRAVCRAEGVGMIHAHFGFNGLTYRHLARELHVPLLTSFYGVDMSRDGGGIPGLRRRYRKLFRHGDGFVAEGPAAAEQLERIGCPSEKIFLHRLGIDPDEVPVVERRRDPDGPLRVLMAARFSEKKGLTYGVEAFCRVARSDPRLELTVVGDAGPVEAERQIKGKLHDLVARYEMEGRVRFPGFLSKEALNSVAREHHLFLHPSVQAANGDAEGGHPVVLTEMAASGMPMIATWHCDIPEIVVHGETGWLCEERSVEDVACALGTALEQPDLLTTYGASARRLVEDRYDARRSTLDEVYARFLDH